MVIGKVGVWDWDILVDKVMWMELLYGIYGMNLGIFDGMLVVFVKLIYLEDWVWVE